MFTLLLFAEVWLGSARLINRDLLQYFFPLGETLARAWHGNGSFLWDSSINGGMPLAARLGPAVFYPVHALFALLPGDAATSVAVLLHFPLAAAATMRLALRYTESQAAAWLAGLAFGFGGYCLSMTGGGTYLYSAALLPLNLLALHRVIEKPGANRSVQLALVVALQVFCGDPQTLFYNVLVLWPVVLLRAASGERWRALPGVLISLGLGAGLAFCQLWPTLELAAQSSRANGIEYAELSSWAFHPLRLAEIAIPSLFGGTMPAATYWTSSLINRPDTNIPWAPGVHVGLLMLLGLLWLAPRERRREQLLWIGATLFFLLCAFGPHTPVHQLLVKLLPGANRFRYPEKFILFVSLGLCLLGGAGLGRLLSTTRSTSPGKRGWLPVACLVVALMLALLWWRSGSGDVAKLILSQGSQVGVPDAIQATTEALLRGAAMALLLLLLLLFWRRLRPQLRTGMMLLIAAADLMLADLPMRHLGGASWLHERPLACSHLPAPEHGLPPLVWRFGMETVIESAGNRNFGSWVEKQRYWDWHSLMPNVGAPSCVRHMDGYEAALSSDFKRLVLALSERRPEALAPIFGVRFALTSPGRLDPRQFPVHAVLPDLHMAIHEMSSLPFAYAVSTAQHASGPASAVSQVVSPQFDFRTTVVLEGTGPLPARPGASRRVALVEHRPGHISLQVDFAAPGYLVVLESHYPGWQAMIDDQPGDLRRANGLFMGLPIPTGQHRVTLRFEPRRQRVGNTVSLASLGAAALGLGLAGWASRRASRKS